jgi:2-polyprenyl-3-methyl-5-hydroxy-6-metoxy-1,4-benzoquinol methylase
VVIVRPDDGFSRRLGIHVKAQRIFASARTETFYLLPPRMDKVLEIGCGTGATLSALRKAGRCRWTMGVEVVESMAREAERCVDEVRIGDVEAHSLVFAPETFDAILCLDVLEHLVDPWTVVRRLVEGLRPGGVLVASVPNVRNIRVVAPLVLFGKWRYTEQGLLDRTHLRFFTRSSAIQLVASAPLDVDRVDGVIWPRDRRVNRLTLGALRRFLDFQYLIRGIKRG